MNLHKQFLLTLSVFACVIVFAQKDSSSTNQNHTSERSVVD